MDCCKYDVLQANKAKRGLVCRLALSLLRPTLPQKTNSNTKTGGHFFSDLCWVFKAVELYQYPRVFSHPLPLGWCVPLPFAFAETEKWEEVGLTGAPCYRSGHSAVVHNDRMYIFAGFNGENLDDMHCIDLGTFVQISSTPAALSRAPLVLLRTLFLPHTLDLSCCPLPCQGSRPGVDMPFSRANRSFQGHDSPKFPCPWRIGHRTH